MLKKRQKPSSEAKILYVLGNPKIVWEKAYRLGLNITLDNYARQFHFKVTHNILYLNKALFNIGISETKLCSFCNLADETVFHLFSHCQKSSELWNCLVLFIHPYIQLHSRFKIQNMYFLRYESHITNGYKCVP